MTSWTRRRVLKGLVRGSAVAVALPLLDCFLNNHGEALASGAPLPVRFGTWFWGCGVNAARWFPDKVGTDYDLKAELLPIGPHKNKVTVLSGFNCLLDGRPNLPHWSGVMATFAGAAPTRGGMGSGRLTIRRSIRSWPMRSARTAAFVRSSSPAREIRA